MIRRRNGSPRILNRAATMSITSGVNSVFVRIEGHNKGTVFLIAHIGILNRMSAHDPWTVPRRPDRDLPRTPRRWRLHARRADPALRLALSGARSDRHEADRRGNHESVQRNPALELWKHRHARGAYLRRHFDGRILRRRSYRDIYPGTRTDHGLRGRHDLRLGIHVPLGHPGTRHDDRSPGTIARDRAAGGVRGRRADRPR